MKTHHHHQDGRSYLICEVPADAYDFEVGSEYIHCKMPPHLLGYSTFNQLQGFTPLCLEDAPLPDGPWHLLGKADELSEERAAQIVESDPHPIQDKIVYDNYQGHDEWDWWFDTATESLASLLQSLGIQSAVILQKVS